eukprot:5597417-Amphidinium_carterae.1
MLAVLGYVNNPLIVGTTAWRDFATSAQFQSKADPDKPLNTSSVVSKISPTVVGKACGLVSAIATARWTRIHLAGGYARPADRRKQVTARSIKHAVA